MSPAEKREAPVPDKYTGLYKGSHGGTELMYRTLTTRLDPKLREKFQIICTRFRELEPGKIPILWMHERGEDPESLRLHDPYFRRQFKKIVFVSDWQFNQFNHVLHVPFSGSIIIKNAIDPLPACEKPRGTINLIYHTTPHRGLEILVPVFIEVAKRFPNVHLDVFSSFDAYGWGLMDKPYSRLFDLCRAHPQISYHGYQPNEVIREALLKAHIFAYPCIWKETSCIAAMEAMSAGVLVVCPNFGALTETVGNCGCMYHFDENNTVHAQIFYTALCNILARFEAEPPLEVMRVAKERIDRFFCWEKRLPEWEHLLTSLL